MCFAGTVMFDLPVLGAGWFWQYCLRKKYVLWGRKQSVALSQFSWLNHLPCRTKLVLRLSVLSPYGPPDWRTNLRSQFVFAYSTSSLATKKSIINKINTFTILRAERFWDRITVGGRFPCTCLERPWGPPRLLHNSYWVIPEGKTTGMFTTHPYPAPRSR
jgi:hypothetical protein